MLRPALAVHCAASGQLAQGVPTKAIRPDPAGRSSAPPCLSLLRVSHLAACPLVGSRPDAIAISAPRPSTT